VLGSPTVKSRTLFLLHLRGPFLTLLRLKHFRGDGETCQIMRIGVIVIPLFQGLFESNILTLNLGWNQNLET
jgi:hypothetical protein